MLNTYSTTVQDGWKLNCISVVCIVTVSLHPMVEVTRMACIYMTVALAIAHGTDMHQLKRCLVLAIVGRLWSLAWQILVFQPTWLCQLFILQPTYEYCQDHWYWRPRQQLHFHTAYTASSPPDGPHLPQPWQGCLLLQGWSHAVVRMRWITGLGHSAGD